VILLTAAVILLGQGDACGEDAGAPPADFTRFEIPSDPQTADTLNRFLWYHFAKRGGNGLVLFNLEYLNVADDWLNAAIAPGTNQTIQAVHRQQLLDIRQDRDGYVETHQHFSHAHDGGWPFPLWTQGGWGRVNPAGFTAGWHFQPLEAVPGWVGDALRSPTGPGPKWYGTGAVEAWMLGNAQSRGIENNRWVIESTGESPVLANVPFPAIIDAAQAPFLQIRWKRSGTPPPGVLPYVSWRNDTDDSMSLGHRFYFAPEKTSLSGEFFHSILPMHTHPKWAGKIRDLGFDLAPGESGVRLEIDSIFTAYDTRHTINNPIFVLAHYHCFGWTGDFDLLRENMNRLRRAVRHMDTEMGGMEHGFIRVPWVGHDGRPGWINLPEGGKEVHGGQGIGSNYWDIMPFGGDDFYATYQYYAALLAMADLEDAVRARPEWGVPLGAEALDPAALRAQAARVKETANRIFWNEEKGRFVACIDRDGTAHDYGFTFLNLDAIWYGIASEEHARAIMDWISGRRVVAGDTSTGADIYRWRFGPRATTLRNVAWYGQGWTHPERLKFGDQVQDGGAVLGFTFYDLWARLQVYGPEDAWQRLLEIVAWEQEVQAAGGYRAYYADGSQGTTLQGCGKPGGIGIDCEFYESSLLPAILTYGFLGLWPSPTGLRLAPKLPAGVPEITVRNLRYQGSVMDITATPGAIDVDLVSWNGPECVNVTWAAGGGTLCGTGNLQFKAAP
jgi:hypothetical protein